MTSSQKRILGAVALSLFLPFSLAAVPDSGHALTAFFNGSITPEKVDQFIAQHPPGSIKRLKIFSTGGDAGASLKLGQWVKQNNLDVEVSALCMSGCANYVFPAGRRKFIVGGGLVLWHGSVEQKDLRELVTKYVQLLLKKVDGSVPLSHDEESFLEERRDNFDAIIKYRETQARFFDSIQVNEFITRLGQEPVDYGIDLWTTTVRVMEKFGITNIDAPDNYGKPSILSGDPLLLLINQGKYLTFDMGEDGEAHRSE